MQKWNRSIKNKSFVETDGKSQKSYVDTFLTLNKSFEQKNTSEMDVSLHFFQTNQKQSIREVEDIPAHIQMA